MTQICFVLIHLSLVISLLSKNAAEAAAIPSGPRANSLQVKGDRLAVATSNSISAVPLLSGSPVTAKSLSMATILQSDDYSIEVFSVSFKDNLVLFGKDVVMAKPIGPGDNYLGAEGVKSLQIEFDSHFAVDWIDYNVYAFKGRRLVVHSLLVPQYSTTVYNGSRRVRNIEVENAAGNSFLAWISNDNNIMRAGKDGSSPVTLWTERTGRIHAMTLSPANGRLYFATLARTVKDVQVPVKVGKDGHEEMRTQQFDAYFVVIHSVDYETAKHDQPMKEATFECNSSHFKVLSLARHHKLLYLVTLDFEQNEDGRPAPRRSIEEKKKMQKEKENFSEQDKPGLFKVYRLWALDHRLKLIREDRRMPITSVAIARANLGGNSSLCQEKQCPQICMSSTGEGGNTATCYCTDNAEICQAIYTPPKKWAGQENSSSLAAGNNTANNSIADAAEIKAPPVNNLPWSKDPKSEDYFEKWPSSPEPFSSGSLLWIIAAVVVLLLLAALLYVGYWCYCSGAAPPLPDETTSTEVTPGTSLPIPGTAGKDTTEAMVDPSSTTLGAAGPGQVQQEQQPNQPKQTSRLGWLKGKLLAWLCCGAPETEETQSLPTTSTPTTTAENNEEGGPVPPNGDATTATAEVDDNAMMAKKKKKKKKKKKGKKNRGDATTTDETTTTTDDQGFNLQEGDEALQAEPAAKDKKKKKKKKKEAMKKAKEELASDVSQVPSTEQSFAPKTGSAKPITTEDTTTTTQSDRSQLIKSEPVVKVEPKVDPPPTGGGTLFSFENKLTKDNNSAVVKEVQQPELAVKTPAGGKLPTLLAQIEAYKSSKSDQPKKEEVESAAKPSAADLLPVKAGKSTKPKKEKKKKEKSALSAQSTSYKLPKVSSKVSETKLTIDIKVETSAKPEKKSKAKDGKSKLKSTSPAPSELKESTSQSSSREKKEKKKSAAKASTDAQSPKPDAKVEVGDKPLIKDSSSSKSKAEKPPADLAPASTTSKAEPPGKPKKSKDKKGKSKVKASSSLAPTEEAEGKPKYKSSSKVKEKKKKSAAAATKPKSKPKLEGEGDKTAPATATPLMSTGTTGGKLTKDSSSSRSSSSKSSKAEKPALAASTSKLAEKAPKSKPPKKSKSKVKGEAETAAEKPLEKKKTKKERKRSPKPKSEPPPSATNLEGQQPKKEKKKSKKPQK